MVEVTRYQQGILDDLHTSAIYLFFRLKTDNQLAESFAILQRLVDGKSCVLGFGEKVMDQFAEKIDYHAYSPSQRQQKLAQKSDIDLVLWLKK